MVKKSSKALSEGGKIMPDFVAIQNGVIIKQGQFNVKPSDIPHKGVVWLPVQRDPVPNFDATTQVLIGPTTTILGDKVTITYSVRAKNSQELDDDKTLQVSSADIVMVKALFNHENRIRVLEGKATITITQFINALKALL